MGAESSSFSTGPIEYIQSDDPKNFRGTTRLSVSSRCFRSLSSAQALIRHRIEETEPKTLHLMGRDRSHRTLHGGEFLKAKDNPRARAEMIESLASIIRKSALVCIEEGDPRLETPSDSSPGGPKTIFNGS